MKKIALICALMASVSGFADMFPFERWPVLEDYYKEMAFHAGLGYESEYVYRGEKRAGHSVNGFAAASYTFCNGEFYAQVLGVRPLKSDESGATEVRYNGGFAYAVSDIITVDGGGTYYHYIDRDDCSGVLSREWEVYVGVSVDVILQPELYFNWNFSREMWVLEGSVGHSFDLSKWCLRNFYIEPSAHAGCVVADEYNGDQRSGALAHGNQYFYVGGKLDLSYKVNDHVSMSVGPRVEYNSDGDPASFTGLKTLASGANARGNHDTMLWWGASVAVDF